jgi:LysR family nitrogen assimilation transcriptional regulator
VPQLETWHLKAFLKIAETGSISRASESLGVAQPSLSQQLVRLEEEVGIPLFQRTARGVTLTEAGRLFQQHARQLLHWTDAAIEEVRQLSTEASGALVLAVPYSVSKVAGVALVEAFLEQAPQVQFRLVEAFTGQTRGWLEEGKIDLGIINDLGPMRNLLSRPIASEELYLVGPSGRFGAQDVGHVAMSELASLPMILPGPQHGLRQVIEHALARHGITIGLRLEVDAMMHVPALIARGHGYSILPLSALSEAVAKERVGIARIADGAIRRTLCLARNSSRVVTHASVRGEALTMKVLTGLIDKGEWQAMEDGSTL